MVVVPVELFKGVVVPVAAPVALQVLVVPVAIPVHGLAVLVVSVCELVVVVVVDWPGRGVAGDAVVVVAPVVVVPVPVAV